jgi:dihydrofolate reductase
MRISLVVAAGLSNQIGLNGNLPWSLKDDLKNFRKITAGHAVLMGRKTFESIGKALPNRTNIVITGNADFMAEGCVVLNSVEDGIDFARNNGESELFVVGGGEIYKHCLTAGFVDRIYLTRVDFDGVADVFFPELDANRWKLTESKKFYKNERNEYDFKVDIFDML